MKEIKKFLAMTLALVLVFDMCKVSEVCAFNRGEDDNYVGLGIAGVNRQQDQVYWENDFNQYWPGREVDVRRTDEFSLALVEGGSVQTLAYDKNLKILQNGQSVGEEIAKIEKGYYRWDEDARKDILVSSKAGIYTARFDEVGAYTLFVDEDDDNVLDDEEDNVTIEVVLPEVGLYRGNEAKESDLVAIPDMNYRYNNGDKIYLVYRNQELIDQMKNDYQQEYLLNAWVEFGPEFKKESIDLIKSNFAPVELVIPDNWAGDYQDSVRVCKEYVDDHSPDGVRIEERRFHFECNKEGLVMADATWDDGRLFATNPEERQDMYSKDSWVDVMDKQHKCIGIRNGEDIALLSMDDLNKLLVLDEDGKAVDENIYTIQQAKYIRWDNEKRMDVEVEAPDVFEFVFKKTGSYIIRYKDGDNVSQVLINVNMPELSVYAKKSAEERLCLGKNVEYNNSRNTFYVMLRNDGDQWHASERYIEKVKSNGDFSLDQVKVDIDSKKGIITVKLDENAKDNFGLRVEIRREEIDYDGQGKETGRRTEYNGHDIWFNYTDKDLSYNESAVADIEAVDAFESKVIKLTSSGKITLDSAKAVTAVRTAYNALTKEQKNYVSDEVYEMLVAAEETIGKLNLEEELKKVKAENTKLVADNKKLLKEKGSEKVNKPAVKVSDVITDTVSKAKYKVLSVGKDNAMGTVEFLAPLSDGNTKFTVPSTITSKGVTYAVVAIADKAFKDNKKLKNVVISEGIKTIGAECFSGCKKLKKITVDSTVVTKVGKDALKGVAKKCVILVPSKKFKKYKKVFKKKGQGKKVKVKKS